MFREMRTSQPTQTEGPAESGAARPDSAAARDERSVEEEIVRMEGEISAALARLDRWEQSAHMDMMTVWPTAIQDPGPERDGRTGGAPPQRGSYCDAASRATRTKLSNTNCFQRCASSINKQLPTIKFKFKLAAT